MLLSKKIRSGVPLAAVAMVVVVVVVVAVEAPAPLLASFIPEKTVRHTSPAFLK